MKRFLKAGFVALVAVAIVATAFTTKMDRFPKTNDEVYTWKKTGSNDPFVGTKTDAQNYYGCSGMVDVCAEGTPNNPGLPNEVIYQH